MKILLIEESKVLRESLTQGFRCEGYLVDESVDGEDGLWRAESGIYDAVILDLDLPKLTGMEVLVAMREKGNTTPVLILTARDSTEERVIGLRAGADDYLTKPFAFDELQARLESLVRRANGASANILEVSGLRIDLAGRTVHIDGEQIHLVRREYALLVLLALRAGMVVSRAEIEGKIYDELVEPTSNVVDAAVSILRKAIDPPQGPSRIETRRGQGYMLRKN